MIDIINERRSAYEGIEDESGRVSISASIGARISIATTNRPTLNSNISNTSMKYVNTNSNGTINNGNNIISDIPEILTAHVPKIIFNDLPLPDKCYTFGFSTVRELGHETVSNLSIDAKTMHREYIVTYIGARTGHLGLSIGKASAATITLIPGQFPLVTQQNINQHNIIINLVFKKRKKSSRIVKQNGNHKYNNCDMKAKMVMKAKKNQLMTRTIIIMVVLAMEMSITMKMEMETQQASST